MMGDGFVMRWPFLLSGNRLIIVQVEVQKRNQMNSREENLPFFDMTVESVQFQHHLYPRKGEGEERGNKMPDGPHKTSLIFQT